MYVSVYVCVSICLSVAVSAWLCLYVCLSMRLCVCRCAWGYRGVCVNNFDGGGAEQLGRFGAVAASITTEKLRLAHCRYCFACFAAGMLCCCTEDRETAQVTHTRVCVCVCVCGVVSLVHTCVCVCVCMCVCVCVVWGGPRSKRPMRLTLLRGCLLVLLVSHHTLKTCAPLLHVSPHRPPSIGAPPPPPPAQTSRPYNSSSSSSSRRHPP